MRTFLFAPLVRVVLSFLLCIALTACGGDSSPSTATPNPPQGNVDDDDDNGNDDDDGSNDDEDDTGVPKATVSPDEKLSPRQAVVIVFDTSMNPHSVEIGGSLGKLARKEWSSGSNENDTLILSPYGYWRPGTRQLVLEASSSKGKAMDPLQVMFDVQTPFADFQAASTVIGQPDFTSGESRQGGLVAAANTLDTPTGGVSWSSDKGILFVADTWDSRVLGFRSIPSANNANADFVIGQPDFHSSRGETSQSRLRTPQAVSADGSRLLVTDTDSQRVVIYEDVPDSGPRDAVAVIGQASFDTDGAGCGPGSLRHVHHSFMTPAGKVLVADADNNRVLVWNEVPVENGQPPDMVIGQSDLDLCAHNDDDQVGFVSPGHEFPSARTLHHPSTVWSDDNMLVVADNYNNRVLIWNEFPQADFAPADVVLGQAAMDRMAPNDDDQDGEADDTASARTLDNPWSVWVENGQLFVADTFNHRVLIWNELPRESFLPADTVLGQDNHSGNLPNAGEEAPHARGFHFPFGVRLVNDRLFVTDRDNSRVLIFTIQD